MDAAHAAFRYVLTAAAFARQQGLAFGFSDFGGWPIWMVMVFIQLLLQLDLQNASPAIAKR